MNEWIRNEEDGWWMLMERVLKYLGLGLLVSMVLVSLMFTDADRDSGQQNGTGFAILANTVFFAVLFYYLNVLRRKILSVWKAKRPGNLIK